jgi:hypothetical protein
MKSFCLWARPLLKGWFIAIPLILLSHTALGGAESQIVAPTGGSPVYRVLGRVMHVDLEGNFLIVLEKKIELVDQIDGNRRFRTTLKDSRGNPLALDAFREGQWVFVRGFKLKNGSVRAREIYQLPGYVSRKDMARYSFFKNVPPWRWEPVK